MRAYLKDAIAFAAKRLEERKEKMDGRVGPTIPGDLYVFDIEETLAVEWLVVRSHPDEPGLVLMVPVDDFPLVGPADIDLWPFEEINRLMIVRCGQAVWLPIRCCEVKTDFIREEPLLAVRRMMAALARGKITTPPAKTKVDADPAYHEWMALISRSREKLRLNHN